MEWYHALEALTPLMLLCVSILVKYVVRSEIKPIIEHIDDHKGRLMVIESWKDAVKADVSTISANQAILVRLEATMSRMDITMSKVNDTMGDVGQRVARIEGAQGHDEHH